MPRLTNLLKDSLTVLRDALIHASARAGLHLGSKTLSKAAAARLRASLKLAEIMLRRLVLLMALEISLPEPAPSRPREPRTRIPRRAGYRFKLFPAHRYNAEAIDALRERPHAARPGPVPAAPLRHRHGTLTALLRHPEKLARRMAFRLRAAKRSAPLVARISPQRGLHRLDARLALTAQAVADQLNAGMRAYFDSG